MAENNTAKYSSFKSSVKLLVCFITALAIENAISELALVVPGEIIARSISDVPNIVWLTFFASTTLTLRFFFGNIEYLNSECEDDPLELLLDSSTIIVQSLVLAYATHYINEPVLFFKYIIFLLLIEFIWFIIYHIQASIRKMNRKIGDMGWAQLNCIIAIFLLIFVGYDYTENVAITALLQDGKLNYWPVALIVILNLFIDIYLNGKRYLDCKVSV